ncbi:hypothetical protein D3C71_1922250 [compost metagenome]
MLGGMDMKQPRLHGVHHALGQHQVALVTRGDEHTMTAVKTLLGAQVEPAFDLFVQASHGQHFAMLVERPGHCNVLQQRQARQR